MISDQLAYGKEREQIRNQKALIHQLKNDYAQCKNLWIKSQQNPTDNSETEKILQIIAWIKTGINELHRTSAFTIEGTTWGALKNIVIEINLIQEELRLKMIESGFNELDNPSLSTR
jgi:hypothetical protein